jgi:hypothetical protein
MKPASKGTVDWFEQARGRCIDHLRAALSIRIARDSAKAILQNWGNGNLISSAAFHVTAVISYCRPFVDARAKGMKIFYPAKTLLSSDRFDKDLHSHILELRNRIIAHADYGIFPSTMFTQTIGDDDVFLLLGIKAKGIFGIESKELAVRYEAHFSACMDRIEEKLKAECNELALESKLHPKEFNATHNVPAATQPLQSSEEFTQLPGPIGPASSVQNPTFSKDFSGYHYLEITHTTPLIESGTHRIMSGGKLIEIEFDADK